MHATALGEEVEGELARALGLHLAQVVLRDPTYEEVAHLLLLDTQTDLHGAGGEVVEAEFNWLGLLQFQKLFLWRGDHVQIDLEFRPTPLLPLSRGLSRWFERAYFEKTRVSEVVDPAYLQLTEMVLLEFIDFQVLILIADNEEVLADLIRVENYWVLKERRVWSRIVLGYVLVIQVNYLHSLRVNAEEEDLVKEDLIDWKVFHFDLEQKLVLTNNQHFFEYLHSWE